MDLRRLDLNLLVIFDRLMETQSVTGAARALAMRQSSVSAALNRLRAVTGDRLLERAGNRMVPTRTATRVWPEIRAALESIDGSLQRLGTFDAAAEAATFRIGIDEYTAMTVGATLARAVADAGPGIRIEFLPLPPPIAEEALSAGRIDLSVGASWTPLPGLRVAQLFADDFVCLVDKRHPRAAAGLDRDSYLAFTHLLISSVGRVEGNVDAALSAAGLQRKVGVTLPYLLAAPQAIVGSDMILNVGRRLAAQLAEWYPVTVLEPPFAVPGFSVAMVWHPRNTESSAHRWLRDRVIEAAGQPASVGHRRPARPPR